MLWAMVRRVFEQALPHVPPEELWWRFERANNLLMANQGRRASRRHETSDEPDTSDERRWLLTFLNGARSTSRND